MGMEPWEKHHRKGADLPILKHVVGLDISRATVYPSCWGTVQKKKGVKFTLVLFLEGWNLLSVASNI